MDPPTAAEAEEGAFEFRNNDAYLAELRLRDGASTTTRKSNYQSTAKRVLKVLKTIPEDRTNRAQWAIAKKVWKEESAADPAMPEWGTIKRAYAIDKEDTEKILVHGQEMVVVEDIQPRFKTEMLDGKRKPKTKAEFQELVEKFCANYYVKKADLDLLITANSATAPVQQQQLALAPGQQQQQVRAPQVPRGLRSSNAAPVPRAPPPYTVNLPRAAPQAAAAAFGAHTATAILSQIRPDQPVVMNFTSNSFAEGANNFGAGAFAAGANNFGAGANNFGAGAFAAGAFTAGTSANFGGTHQSHQQNNTEDGNDGAAAASKEDIAMLASKLDAVGTKVDDGTATITKEVQQSTVQIQESAVKMARARPSPVACGGTNLDGNFAASSSAKSPSHEEHRTWKSTDFLDFQTMHKRTKDRVRNFEEDFDEGDVKIPELWVLLRDLNETCTNMRSLLELVKQGTVRTTPHCCFFLYASEIDEFQPHEKWSE